MARKQRRGPRGEFVGMRVRCTLPAPAELAEKTGELVREIANGRQWLIEWDGGELFHTPTGKMNQTWLWTTDFAPITEEA
jgi:hypothetical protein